MAANSADTIKLVRKAILNANWNQIDKWIKEERFVYDDELKEQILLDMGTLLANSSRNKDWRVCLEMLCVYPDLPIPSKYWDQCVKDTQEHPEFIVKLAASRQLPTIVVMPIFTTYTQEVFDMIVPHIPLRTISECLEECDDSFRFHMLDRHEEMLERLIDYGADIRKLRDTCGTNYFENTVCTKCAKVFFQQGVTTNRAILVHKTIYNILSKYWLRYWLREEDPFIEIQDESIQDESNFTLRSDMIEDEDMWERIKEFLIDEVANPVITDELGIEKIQFVHNFPPETAHALMRHRQDYGPIPGPGNILYACWFECSGSVESFLDKLAILDGLL